MKLRLALWGTGASAVLSLLLVLGPADQTQAGPARAATFDPTFKATVAAPTPEATSDLTLDISISKGDVNFASVVFFIPGYWGLPPAKDIPIGAVVGEVKSTSNPGIFNSPCNTALPVTFTMLNASIDETKTVSYDDADHNGTPDFAEDKDKNGLFDAVDKYPDWLTRVLKDQSGKPLQPLRRSAGLMSVAALPTILQFLIFPPGTVIDPNVPHDESLGNPAVAISQNTGDPNAAPPLDVITDVCSPIRSLYTSYGVSKDNPDTTVNEAGQTLFVNPGNGTYTFTAFALGQRDADADGIENGLDTCPFTPNAGDPRDLNRGDAKNLGNGLDDACNTTNPPCTVDDCDNDGYSNRGDNCPLVANGQEQADTPGAGNQTDTDGDGIGDACDSVGAGGIGKGPTVPDGDYTSAQRAMDITIGSGSGAPSYPSGFGPSGGGGVGGLGTGAIIGIIAGVALVVILIGSAFAVARRHKA